MNVVQCFLYNTSEKPSRSKQKKEHMDDVLESITWTTIVINETLTHNLSYNLCGFDGCEERERESKKSAPNCSTSVKSVMKLKGLLEDEGL